MIILLLAAAWATTPDLIAEAVPEARATLERCETAGCDRTQAAQAGWIVALHTYLDQGYADGDLATTVAWLDPQLYAAFPDVLQEAEGEAFAWAAHLGTDPDPVIVETAKERLARITRPAKPAQVLVIYKDMDVDVEKVRRTVKSQIARPSVEWLEESLGPDTLEALLRYPNECSPTISPETRARLESLSGEPELYVVASTTRKHKDLAMWRWDRRSKKLLRVMSYRNKLKAIPLDTPARILHLTGAHTTPQPLNPRALASIHRVNPTIQTTDLGADFVDKLMEHPNECEPEMTSEMIETLKTEAAKTPDTDLYVFVQRGRGNASTLVWRWTDGRLSRVMNTY